MSRNRIMGLDLSLNGTGISVVDEGLSIVFSHRVTLNTGTKAFPELYGMERANFIINVMKDIIENHQPNVVVLEGYSYGSKGRAVFDLGELGGIVRYVLSNLNIPFYEVPPTTLKKYISGKGNADKDMMMAAALSRYGKSFNSHDECDAFCLAAMFLEMPLEDFRQSIGEKSTAKKKKAKKKSS